MLGTLHSDLATGAAADVAILDRSIWTTLRIAKHWLGQYERKREGCLHECFWALNVICAGAGVSTTWWMERCEEIADTVLSDRHYKWYEEEQFSYRKEHKLRSEAKKLKTLVNSV